jgi:hypothetical protein
VPIKKTVEDTRPNRLKFINKVRLLDPAQDDFAFRVAELDRDMSLRDTMSAELKVRLREQESVIQNLLNLNFKARRDGSPLQSVPQLAAAFWRHLDVTIERFVASEFR